MLSFSYLSYPNPKLIKASKYLPNFTRQWNAENL